MSHFLSVLRRYSWLILLCGIIGGILGAMRLQDTAPEWAVARVNLVAPLLEAPERQPGILPSAIDIEAERRILESYAVREKVRYTLGQITASELRYSNAEGKYQVPIHRLGEEIPTAGIEIVTSLGEHLRIESGGSPARLHIAVRQTPPLDAVRIANAIADEYVRLKQQLLRQQIEALEAEQTAVDAQIQRAEAAREAFLKQHPNFVPGADATAAPAPNRQQIEKLDRQLATLRREIGRLGKMLEQVRAHPDPVELWARQGSAFPGAKVDGPLARIETLEEDRMRFLQQYTPQHPLMRQNSEKLKAAKSELRQVMVDAITAQNQRMQRQVSRLESKKRSLQRSRPTSQEIARLQKEYTTLKAAVDEASTQFGDLSARLTPRQAQLQQLSEQVNLTRAEELQTAHRSYRPVWWGILYGLLAGILLTCLVAGIVTLLSLRREKPERDAAVELQTGELAEGTGKEEDIEILDTDLRTLNADAMLDLEAEEATKDEPATTRAEAEEDEAETPVIPPPVEAKASEEQESDEQGDAGTEAEGAFPIPEDMGPSEEARVAENGEASRRLPLSILLRTTRSQTGRHRPPGAVQATGPGGYALLGRIPELDFSVPALAPTAVSGDANTSDSLGIRLSPPAEWLPNIEAFRQLRTHLLFREQEAQEGGRLLAFVSAQPGEGVSTVTANMAVSFAQAGQRTLLIEGDLRDPQLHDAFGLSRVPGITDVMLETVSIEEAIRNGTDLLLGDLGPDVLQSVPGIGNLHFLFAGTPPGNVSEILSMPAFTDLVLAFRQAYDFVLLDCGCVLSDSAMQVLATLTDGTLLVHCPRKRGGRKALARVKEALQSADVWGVVLNDVPKEYL